MKHEAVTTHTWKTEDGIILTIDFANERFQKMTVQFPGSGNTPKRLTLPDLRDLAEITAEANHFLVVNGVTGAKELETEPEVRLG